jgi:predicted phage-related endonuclease
MPTEWRTITTREQWLAWRKADVTASTVGALFAVHPYCTALKLYAEKRGVEFEQKDTSAMRRGRWLEPAIAKAVAEKRPDWKVEPATVYCRDPELNLGATPDFFIDAGQRGRGVLQGKTVTPAALAQEWIGEPPLWITLQCLTEMMLTDSQFGAVAALVVDPFQMDVEIFPVPRNPSAELKIVGAVTQFWKTVRDGIEPEPDFGRDADVIRAITRDVTRGKEADLAGHNMLPEMLERRAGLMGAIKTAEAECEAIETEIKFLMRDAETASLRPGWRITFKKQDRDGYTVAPKSSRVLRIYDKRGATP